MSKPQLLRKFELNTGRFNPFACSKRTTDTVREIDVLIGSRRLKGVITSALPVPHGKDADVFYTLLSMYIEDNCPEGGEILTTPYALLRRMQSTISGQDYHFLRESLGRIRAAVIQAREGWWDAEKNRWAYNNDDLNLFIRTRFRDYESDERGMPELDENGALSVQLHPVIARQVALGFLRSADPNVLKALKQPMSRTLYMTLEAHRVQDDGSLVEQLVIGTSDLAQLAGLTGRPDNVKRALDNMLTDLRESDYLRSVRLEGRSFARGQFVIEFNPIERLPDPLIVEALTGNGVKIPTARKTALEFEDERDRLLQAVRDARRIFEERQLTARPIKSLGAFTVDLIRNPLKYADTQPERASVRPAPKRRAAQARDTSVAPSPARIAAPSEPDVQPEDHATLAAGVAMFFGSFGLRKADLLPLPFETLRQLRSEAIAATPADRALLAESVRAMLSALR